MADENTATAVDGKVASDPDVDAITTDDPRANDDDGDLDVEAFARELGHIDKDKFRGKEDEWLPPAAFVKKALKEAGTAKARVKFQDQYISKQDRELAELKELVKGVKDTQTELVERQRNAETRGFNRYREDIEAAMDKAIEDADVATARRLRAELAELDKHRPQAPKKEPEAPAKKAEEDKPQGQNGKADPATEQWVEDNPWFLNDRALHRHTMTEELNVIDDMPHLKGAANTAERLAEVKKRIMARFPEKFENQNRKAAAAVGNPSGQGNGAAKRSRPKTVADLPEEAKAGLAAIKRKDPKFKDQTYVDTWFASDK